MTQPHEVVTTSPVLSREGLVVATTTWSSIIQAPPVPVESEGIILATAAVGLDAASVDAASVGLRVLRLSASQVQLFRNCQRAWAWKYVAKVETPSNAAAELGGVIHKELENYLEGGSLDFTIEAGNIAASGLEHLPLPGTPGMEVEIGFHFYGPSGHSYLGYKDVELPPGAWKAANGRGVVIDHKSTSDFRWAKTSETLPSDVQATLYAVDFFRLHPDQPEVELRWVYYRTKGSKQSLLTVAVVNQQDTWRRFLEIEKTAEEMAVASYKQPLELPASINHCSAFGGCPHQGRCNISPLDKMRSYMNQSTLLSRMTGTTTMNGAAPLLAALPPAAGAASTTRT